MEGCYLVLAVMFADGVADTGVKAVADLAAVDVQVMVLARLKITTRDEGGLGRLGNGSGDRGRDESHEGNSEVHHHHDG